MGKWKKKLRKFAKKAVPLAMLGLGAAALAKRRKAKALNAITAGDIVDTGPLSGKIGYEGDFSSAAPGANKAWKIKNSLAHKNWNKLDESEVDWNYNAPSTQRYHKPNFGFGVMAKDGGRIGHKSGGRVGCGKAKRGFGRALKKK